MKIAVLSGKGGAGKTFVATNLAVTSQIASMPTTYIDCDVEEPNGHLFLKPEQVQKEEVFTYVPKFDAQSCTGCKKCVSACRFNALVFIKRVPMLFPDICHGCGACEIVCEAKAVSEDKHSVGFVEIGARDALRIVTGIMHAGEVSAVPIIKQTLEMGCQTNTLIENKSILGKKIYPESSLNIENKIHVDDSFIVIDCPPGSACSVMESVQEADFCLLVVEPTAFGVHNFKMVYELVTLLEKPCAVVINKVGEIYQPLEDFCMENNVPIFARFEDKQNIAKISSDAEIVVHFDTEIAKQFKQLYETLIQMQFDMLGQKVAEQKSSSVSNKQFTLKDCTTHNRQIEQKGDISL